MLLVPFFVVIFKQYFYKSLVFRRLLSLLISRVFGGEGHCRGKYLSFERAFVRIFHIFFLLFFFVIALIIFSYETMLFGCFIFILVVMRLLALLVVSSLSMTGRIRDRCENQMMRKWCGHPKNMLV